MTHDTVDSHSSLPRRRGRPRKAPDDQASRQALVKAGLVHLTERGYASVGVDEILRGAGVPKGSFYYHFKSKAAFGAVLIDTYHAYFAAKLDHWFSNQTLDPLDRLRGFTEDAEAGMARHDFSRGCLVGNLGQEMAALPPEFRAQICDVLLDWQDRTAACLQAAQAAGEIGPDQDPDALAAFFWIGWEGAVLRAKLDRSPEPLRIFSQGFFQMIAVGE